MEPENMSLVALSPSEMPVVQTALVEWCGNKLAAIGDILTDLRKNLEIATRNRWGSRQSLDRAIKREEKREDYYGKVKAAIQAGYLIIPNFPVSALAVRVKDGSKPRWMTGEWRTNRLVDAQPQQLRAGEGHYVDDQKVVENQSWIDESNKTHRRFTANEYDEEIDFPLVDVKPVILEAAERAMALRIFDRIGVVQQRPKEDPILVGQIEGKFSQKGATHTVTFFLAWWLNVDNL